MKHTAPLLLLALLFLPLSLAHAVSLDSEGTAYWDPSWSSPSEMDYTFSATERTYAFRGEGHIRQGNESDALPNLYFTYKLEGHYNLNTNTAEEHLTISSSAPQLGAPLTYGAEFACSQDPWLNRSGSCSMKKISGSLNAPRWFSPPLRNKILTDAQVQMLNDAARKEARKLKITEPQQGVSYSSSTPRAFMIRQELPDDMNVQMHQNIRLQLEDTSGNQQPVTRTISRTGSNAYWGTTIDLEPGSWRARAYAISPVAQAPSDAQWTSFTVKPSQVTGEPLQQKPFGITSPRDGKTYLKGKAIALSFEIPAHKVSQASLIEVRVNRLSDTKPGTWPLPPTEVYTTSWTPSGGLALMHAIPADALQKTGRYEINATFYPDGKSGSTIQSYTSRASFTIGSIMQAPIKKMPQFKILQK
ncbi:hypothetical protein INT08_04685 [Prosthecochloris sp. N3]|uniref:Uncharacterized protein n=1 Tax=Prosthecochloris ethylica TaxID=2743976 RepID=A0ABR9XRN9_9CHLB|nr:hypothetical protein [Prosthecochloris ethylica]MBF0586307.1 hypothetical protein [Prosthecochloris ethylica]MBF0636475.1 hypothetical protein [Prosthecochloris ethylica]NUK47649.1 hypothetical protein [Prosthecochloris ethylica]